MRAALRDEYEPPPVSESGGVDFLAEIRRSSGEST
jgi:hypothetical protein